MKCLELRFLGGLHILLDGVPLDDLKSNKGRALLCYLAVTGIQHSRSALAGLLWADMPEEGARANLRKTLSRMKPHLGAYLRIDRESIAFNRDSDFHLDVAEFEDGVQPGAEFKRMQDALSLYKGDFLEGYYLPDAPLFDEWTLVQRARLRSAALRALDTLAVHFTNQKDYNTAITYTRRLLEIEPWYEEAHRELMGLLAFAGQRSAALRQYEICQRILLEELDVEPSPATMTLYEKILKGQIRDLTIPDGVKVIETLQEAQLAIQQGISLYKLPAQRTPFIGRDNELGELARLLRDPTIRLVNICGAGGIGKTRLALGFAEYLVGRQKNGDPSGGISHEIYPDGIFFVPLESLDSRDLILPAVAEAMNFRMDHGPSQLLDYLNSKQLLLILDNFEHLLDGVDSLSEILVSAPGVSILSTSREPLRMQGEQLFPLKGLEVPTIGADNNALNYPSEQLFLYSARRHKPDYKIDDSEIKHLAHICLLVEGMPLAIELAATWVSSLPLSTIADEIQKNFDFLATEFRDIPSRHRSVRAVIDVSWEQLTPSQQQVFAGLSVFRGGFTREAGEEIAGASYADLAAMVSKSFLRYVKSQDRYYTHELLRQYGAEMLAGRPEQMETIQDRHSRYYCQWSADQARSENLLSVGQDKVLDSMALELENVRAAWTWALESHQISRIWDKASVLGRYYIWRGGYQEGRRTFRTFADLLDEGGESTNPSKLYLRATFLDWLAFFLYELGERASVLEHLKQSMTLLDSPILADLDTRREKAHNLVILARTDWSLSEEERLKLMAKARSYYREVRDLFGLPFALTFSARLALLGGRLEEARQFIEEGLQIYEDNGNLLGRAISLTGLGNLAFMQNEYDQAVGLLGRAVELARQIGSRERILISSLHLGIAYLYSGQFTQALHLFGGCLADSRDQGFFHYQATSLYYAGYSYLHLGSYDHVVRCGNEVLEMHERTGDDTAKHQALLLLGSVALVRGFYQEAIDAFERVDRERDIWSSGKFMFAADPGKVGRGAALTQLGEIDQASLVFSSFLQGAQASHRQDQVLYAIVGFALLNARKGAPERAFELFSTASRFPLIGNSRWIADCFGQHIIAAAGTLTTHREEELKSKSENRCLWEMAEELQKMGE